MAEGPCVCLSDRVLSVAILAKVFKLPSDFARFRALHHARLRSRISRGAAAPRLGKSGGQKEKHLVDENRERAPQAGLGETGDLLH